MTIYLEMPSLNPDFGFRFIENKGDILTTPHWHREYELILLTKGSIYLGINDKQYHLEKDSIIFFKSGDIHYIVATPDSYRYVYQFDMRLFNEIIVKKIELEHRLNHVSQISTSWNEQSKNKIKDILLEIVKEEKHPEGDSEFVVQSLMYQLVTIMIRELPKSNELPKSSMNLKSKEILETLNKVFTFVEHRYQEKITLEDVSNEIGFSQYYFTRFFKKMLDRRLLNS